MKILDKAFPLASAPLLRPLIMRVLTKIDNIPQGLYPIYNLESYIFPVRLPLPRFFSFQYSKKPI